MWRDVHAGGPSCTGPLSATSAICCEEVPHQGLPDDEGCCGTRDQSPCEKCAEGSDSADLEEQGNEKLLVRCLNVMEALSIRQTFRH